MPESKLQCPLHSLPDWKSMSSTAMYPRYPRAWSVSSLGIASKITWKITTSIISRTFLNISLLFSSYIQIVKFDQGRKKSFWPPFDLIPAIPRGGEEGNLQTFFKVFPETSDFGAKYNSAPK